MAKVSVPGGGVERVLELGDIGGERLYMVYWDCGADRRPTLVLLHGIFDHKGTWRPLIEGLVGRYRLVAPDLVGSGRSAKPRLDGAAPGYAYSAAMHCDHLERLLDEIGGPVVLAGNSLGGGIALYLMRTRPAVAARVQGLVLVDAAAYPQELPGYIGLLGGRVGRLLAAAGVQALVRSSGLGRRIVQRTFRRAFYDPGKIPSAQVEEAIDLMGEGGLFYAYHLAARHIRPADIDAVVAGYGCIDCPALVLWGGEDGVLPAADGRRLAAELPRARWRLLSACGHAPQLEQTDTVAEEIIGWMETNL